MEPLLSHHFDLLNNPSPAPAKKGYVFQDWGPEDERDVLTNYSSLGSQNKTFLASEENYSANFIVHILQARLPVSRNKSSLIDQLVKWILLTVRFQRIMKSINWWQMVNERSESGQLGEPVASKQVDGCPPALLLKKKQVSSIESWSWVCLMRSMLNNGYPIRSRRLQKMGSQIEEKNRATASKAGLYAKKKVQQLRSPYFSLTNSFALMRV